MKMTNLGEDWLSFEIKVVGPKLTVYLDGKMLIMGLEEPDIKFIAERSGTMMFGVNDVMAQFSDIFMSQIPPPSEQELAAAAANSSSPGAGGPAGLETSDAEEMEFDEEDDATGAAMNGAIGMRTCSEKNNCTARKAWCKSQFMDNIPADCLENFTEYCCGINAISQLEECKQESDLNHTEEEPLNFMTVLCFDQTTIEIDKNKYDQCAACCNNKINNESSSGKSCYTQSSSLRCINSCQTRFPFTINIVLDSGDSDENETSGERQELAAEQQQEWT